MPASMWPRSRERGNSRLLLICEGTGDMASMWPRSRERGNSPRWPVPAARDRYGFNVAALT